MVKIKVIYTQHTGNLSNLKSHDATVRNFLSRMQKKDYSYISHHTSRIEGKDIMRTEITYRQVSRRRVIVEKTFK